jgi:hypothetical protein
MFSLIITVVAIVLVVALALATYYYGGTVWKTQGSSAKAAQVVLEGQQIAAAIELYRAKNSGTIPSLDQLTLNGEYLSNSLKISQNAVETANKWNYRDSQEYVIYPMTDVEACKKANRALGLELSEIPLCSAVAGKTICCQADEPTTP